MKAAVLRTPGAHPGTWLKLEDVPRPDLAPGELLLRVLSCGICRTDLHIAEGDLPLVLPNVIPGHQIVGEVVAPDSAPFPAGTRVGVSWMGGVDGTCPYCARGLENLCDNPTFTGYTVHGGYAEYTTVRAEFAYPLPPLA